ncbi:MAG TPA: hypothetical protein PLY14_04320 [Deltaproteobacteria bacterium]|nr:hypothetical protein [Deltaproteobacteria bacterium]HOG83934.1 hypothetical protein [Deltaproteobacteria bacterium]
MPKEKKSVYRYDEAVHFPRVYKRNERAVLQIDDDQEGYDVPVPEKPNAREGVFSPGICRKRDRRDNEYIQYKDGARPIEVPEHEDKEIEE